MNTDEIFQALNGELKASGLERHLIICGGAALIALGVIARETRDVDVLEPVLDRALLDAAARVGRKLGLSDQWLNNGPRALTETLPKGWQARCTDLFQGDALRIKSLGRLDLIFTKLDAAASRVDDIRDLVRLKPTPDELAAAEAWALRQDASEIWPKIVSECLAELKKRLGHARR